jgi:CheY-like chemotaxis protein
MDARSEGISDVYLADRTGEADQEIEGTDPGSAWRRQELAELLGGEGYEVIVAKDGCDGLNQLRAAGRPCIILSI